MMPVAQCKDSSGSHPCLTAGGLEEANSMERFQRLSDLVLAAVV